MENYLNTSLIGEGSFSKVYLSKNRTSRKKCVLKVVNVEDTDFKNCLTEIHIMTKNKSKYLVSCNEVFFDVSKKAITIELPYFPNGDLADKIRTHADKNDYFPEDTVWQYFSQDTLWYKILTR